jgi:hypothetical protein
MASVMVGGLSFVIVCQTQRLQKWTGDDLQARNVRAIVYAAI